MDKNRRVGVAVCNPKDRFNKRRSIQIATARATKCPETLLLNVPKKRVEDIRVGIDKILKRADRYFKEADDCKFKVGDIVRCIINRLLQYKVLVIKTNTKYVDVQTINGRTKDTFYNVDVDILEKV